MRSTSGRAVHVQTEINEEIPLMIRYMRTIALMAAVGLVLAAAASAQSYPLSSSAPNTTALEGSAPFVNPFGVSQSLVTDRNTLNAVGLAPTFGIWDMVAFSPDSRYIFIPSEESTGGGLFRYDSLTGAVANMAVGNDTGVRESNPALFDPSNDEFSRIDPATWTPAGTVIFGEETTGGRLFECTNPLAAGGFAVRWLSKIPAVAHEGLRFDDLGNLYFVDEDNSGSIYKFVPATPGDLTSGRTYVLSVNAYAADPAVDASANWNAAANLASTRTGLATWVPMTDAVGNKLTTADPFAYVTTTGGRSAADELKGTPYGRPEDLHFERLANGREVFYFAATSENSVIAVELISTTQASVRVFADRNTVNEATGAAIGTQLSSPDNIAIDAWGNVYIIEDQNPGDIFLCRDDDNDGVAESLGRIHSLGVAGSEPSGLEFDPNNPYRAICCVQHPSSGNDALWSFDYRPYDGTNDDMRMRTSTGSTVDLLTGPGHFVKTAKPFEQIVIELSSPAGSLNWAPAFFFYDLFVSGFPAQVPGAPFLHVDIASTVIVLDGGAPSLFTPVLPPQGLYFGAVTPPGLAGFSVMLQGGVYSANTNLGIAAVTDGHEVRFIL